MSTLRIDTHQHVVPPAYAAWMRSRGITAGGWAMPDWSVEGAHELMAGAKVGTGMLSISTPGVHIGDDGEARERAREFNEYTAAVVKAHPGRFGFFATLTLPDVEGAIAEADYAYDHLGADGVILLTNVGRQYLGDAEWDPLFAALEKRKAVIFVHPADLPGEPLETIPPHVCDFLLNTTRAAINMAKSGMLERYPNLKIILAHGGGFLPYAAERVARTVSPDGTNPPGLARLRKFWFDIALASSPYALPSLLAFADPAQITYGSDWPYAPKERGWHFARQFEEFAMDPAARYGIERGNAERLFPRLAGKG